MIEMTYCDECGAKCLRDAYNHKSFCKVCKKKKKTFKQPLTRKDLPEETLQKTVTVNAGKDFGAISGYYIHSFKCEICGNEFGSKRSDAKTCSTRCRVAAARAKEPSRDSIRDQAIRAAIGRMVSENAHSTYTNNIYNEVREALKNPNEYMKKINL